MGIEFDILYWFQSIHSGILDKIMVAFTSLGNAGMFWIALALVLACTKKYRKVGLTMGIALLLSLIMCNGVMKNFVARPRPCWIDPSVQLLVKIPADYSFPSGHTSASFAAALVLWMYNKKTGFAAIFLATIIGISRLYLFVHFPSDVIVSVFLGSLYGVIAFYIMKWIDGRFPKAAKFLNPLNVKESEM